MKLNISKRHSSNDKNNISTKDIDLFCLNDWNRVMKSENFIFFFFFSVNITFDLISMVIQLTIEYEN